LTSESNCFKVLQAAFVLTWVSAKQSIHLAQAAIHLIQGGFTIAKVQEAKQLVAGAQSLFNSLRHMGEPHEDGLGEEHFVEDWKSEHKRVFMFSGCRDDQTSADATIGSSHVGAMSWAFLEVMNSAQGNLSYLEILQNTRALLARKYAQIPQLSVGYEMDLNQQFTV
jgi:hypothetical protein